MAHSGSHGSTVALVGQACRFPDAATPAALLANTLEGRRSFRAIPPERLALADYAPLLVGEADSITKVPAGLITDWRFDTARFRVPRSAFAAADPAHWLALEVAADAIQSAGGAAVLDPERTAVIVANTLTGEFSRAALLRLRWPWLDRQLAGALREAGASPDLAAWARRDFRSRLTSAFREPDEESLAGGLANTIAGRIANHFDLHGGAWSVDAACASSLVAIANAAELIESGRASAVIVAAVDLSLDPFELVGFSRNGALAKGAMRVFDRRAEGFWPGEGAGAVVLMAKDHARRKGLSCGVSLAGWGVATDGRGGLTRPDAGGQRRALERAYARAAIDPADLGYVEAHGTGTAVGDPTEVRALAAVAGRGRRAPLPIASIKANIGHTKAAAGLAGLIRTAEAMAAGIVPPHSSCEQPHPVFAETGDCIMASDAPLEWRPGARRVAGVSSFGFGGVNAHVVLTRHVAPSAVRHAVPAMPPIRDAELFLFSGEDAADLRRQVAGLAARAGSLSLAELGDAAADRAARLRPAGLRLALVASSPEQLVDRLAGGLVMIDGAENSPAGIHFGRAGTRPRIGLVFPGQAAPVRPHGGAWARRFPGRYTFEGVAPQADLRRTDIAQPAIMAASMAGLDLLERLSIPVSAALGHSLGELAALAWAGAIDRAGLMALATARGRAMAALEPGAMLRLACGRTEAVALAKGLPLAVACLNAADETIMSGPFHAVDALEGRAVAAGVDRLRLAVSHAFHSPAMAAAAPALRQALAATALAPPMRAVASTVTGGWIAEDQNIGALLVEQLTAPVQFAAAASLLPEAVDVLVEVGPGAGLTRLLSGAELPAMSLDVFADSTVPALEAIAALFVRGCDLDPAPLFEGPGIRPFTASAPVFLSSPCGTRGEPFAPVTSPRETANEPPVEALVPAEASTLATLIALVADETGLDAAGISGEDRFLDDLHLNSLAVSRLTARLGRMLGRSPAGFATAFADARLADVAESFDESEALHDPVARPRRVAGVAPWVRRFTMVSAEAPAGPMADITWQWTDLARGAPDVSGRSDGLTVRLGEAWNCARDAAPLLRLCQQAAGRFRHLAICHADAPLGGFARSIAAENLFGSVRLIEGADGCALDDLLHRHVVGFAEYRCDDGGRVTSPKLALAADPPGRPATRPPVILVTGGVRGIAAECAIRLAERHAAAVILAGRTPEADRDVAAALARFRAVKIPARYVQADLADPECFGTKVADAVADIGAITHLIHAAGVNEPTPFRDIDDELLARTLAPKVQGLSAAVEACGPSLVRVVAFGSIIARLGLAGEAHYALANAEQTRLLDAIAAARPALSALSIEWSVWSGAGMGERLGVIDRLEAAGTDAISLDSALDAFEDLALGGAEGSVVVTSRFGSVEPLPPGTGGRFLDRVLVHTPGVELVVETTIGPGRDPYLDDHRVDGAAIVPGVMLMEMMAQVGSVLAPGAVTGFRDLRFRAALAVDDDDLTIRIAALRRADGSIDCEIRCARDAFGFVSASARLSCGRRPKRPDCMADVPPRIDAFSLYGPLFFQGPVFRRVAAVGEATSRRVAAMFKDGDGADWFGGYEDRTLLLGDPSARDAALHVLQCCVPHCRLIPLSAAAIDFFPGGPAMRMRAVERWCRNGDYCFDIVQADAEGRVVERWKEAVFHAIGTVDVNAVLAAAPGLAPAYLERLARAATGDDTLLLALVDDPRAGREDRRSRAAAALGLSDPPLRRGDGRPLARQTGRAISFSHAGSVTVAVSAASAVGCDIERLAAFAAGRGRLDLAKAWTAEEALRKTGSKAPLSPLFSASGNGFTGGSGERIVAIGPIPTQGADAVAVAVGVAPAGGGGT